MKKLFAIVLFGLSLNVQAGTPDLLHFWVSGYCNAAGDASDLLPSTVPAFLAYQGLLDGITANDVVDLCQMSHSAIKNMDNKDPVNTTAYDAGHCHGIFIYLSFVSEYYSDVNIQRMIANQVEEKFNAFDTPEDYVAWCGTVTKEYEFYRDATPS